MPKTRIRNKGRADICLSVSHKIGGREGHKGVKQLSNEALVGLAKSNSFRKRDTNKICNEMIRRNLTI